MQLPARAAKNLINNVAVKPGMSANVLLRNGHLANVIKGRDRFIREAVLEQDFRSGQVSEYHLSNVSRAAEELVESGKSSLKEVKLLSWSTGISLLFTPDGVR